MTLLGDFLVARGLDVLAYPLKQGWLARMDWRRTFAGHVKRSTGKWVVGTDAAAFCYPSAVCLKGPEARDAYDQLIAKEFVAFTSKEHEPIFLCRGKPPLYKNVVAFVTYTTDLIDVYLSDPNFAWTMVFTHEIDMDFGPYFSRKEWQTSGLGNDAEPDKH
jgi:hypothetical protein